MIKMVSINLNTILNIIYMFKEIKSVNYNWFSKTKALN